VSRLSVSAVVVVRNGERFLALALGSILSQTRPPDEILVIDGASTDATAEIVRSFAAVTLLQQPGTGLANARNAGIATAAGELIAFLDYDDLWQPRKIEVQAGRLEVDPDLDYCHSHVRLFVRSEERV
jgi:glycosyltransferase involved in cell wall biosynthesis